MPPGSTFSLLKRQYQDDPIDWQYERVHMTALVLLVELMTKLMLRTLRPAISLIQAIAFTHKDSVTFHPYIWMER
jgi:hypothetical protein